MILFIKFLVLCFKLISKVLKYFYLFKLAGCLRIYKFKCVNEFTSIRVTNFNAVNLIFFCFVFLLRSVVSESVSTGLRHPVISKSGSTLPKHCIYFINSYKISSILLFLKAL